MTEPNPLDNALDNLLNNLVGAPTWLVAKVDQRVQHIEHKAGEGIDAFARDGGSNPLVMTTLTEPEELKVSMDKWERTCDNCGSYTPHGEAFFTGTTARKLRHGQYVVITFGMCSACKELP